MMDEFSKLIFWTSAALLAYVYIGYPMLLWLLGMFRAEKTQRRAFEPRVSVLITAFNEEAAIREKLENTLAIDYPKDLLEIIVASDGSTDRTDEIVNSFKDRNVTLFRQEGRVGKTETQNNAVGVAKGEIILFSDATTMYQPDVFRTVLPGLDDPSVGCVAGRLIYLDQGSTYVGEGLQRYWGYETFLKTMESRVCSLIGASGCLYAVRRSAYRRMYPEACSDFLICTVLYRQGLRTIFVPEALCFEKANARSNQEMSMRVRVISQTLTDLWRNRDMMNPFKSGFFAVELISHKLLRYAVPIMLVILFCSTAVLSSTSPFYVSLLLLQLVFYSLAAAGWMMERTGKRLSVLAMPLYFVLANLASAVAFYKFVRGEKYASWEPIR